MTSFTPSMYFSSSHTKRLLPIPAGPVVDARRMRRSRPVVCRSSLRRRRSSSRPTNGASSVSQRPAPPRCATTGGAGSDRVHQLERRANRPLGVVLVGGGGAPDSHDRVSDEFFDGASVALDDLPPDVEVPAEEFAHLLRVLGFGVGGEPDEVGE